MADKCCKCDVGFGSTDCPVKCNECKLFFHPTCTRLGSAKLTKSSAKSWKCDGCAGETSSDKSAAGNISEDTKTILEAMEDMKRSINSNTDAKIDAVKKSIANLSQDIGVIKGKIEKLETSLEETKQRCDELDHARENTDADVRDLRLRLHDAEQYSRCANVEIVGVPATQNEDVYDILGKIAREIGIPYKREDFSISHRLRLFSKKHAHAPIIAQFVSRTVRDAWLAAGRKKRNFYSTDLEPSLPKSQVFINEHLTAHNKALLGRARRMVRQKKLHYAGIHNGKVLVRKTEQEAAIRILELEDLDEFDRE